MKKCKNRLFIKLSALTALLFAVTLCLCACNGEDDGGNSSGGGYALYFNGFDYDASNAEIVAYVGLSGKDENLIAGTSAQREYSFRADGLWYNVGTTDYFMPSSALYSAVDEFIPQEARIKDGIVYSGLKVTFRYVTIYKSIKTDGNAMRSGRYYVHDFVLDKQSDEQDFAFVRTSYNAANWYSALICAALVLFTASVAAYLAVSGEKCRKK